MYFKDINCGFHTAAQPSMHVSSFEDVTRNQIENHITERAMYNYGYYAGDVKTLNSQTVELCAKTYGSVPVLRLYPQTFAQDSYNKSELITLIDGCHPLFRIRPKVEACPFTEWMYGPILKVLEESSTPLIIAQDEVEITQAAQIKAEHPGIIIILINTWQFQNRQFLQFARCFPNIYVDTSCVIEYCGLETMAETIGADKVLFGTYTPEKEPYDKIMQLMFCGLSSEQKELIAYGNYDRLMKGRC